MNKDPNTLSDKELSAWLGEVLQPEKQDHKLGFAGGLTYCRKCQHTLVDCNGVTRFAKQACVSDPIPLDDWNVAMKWRDWAVEEVGNDNYFRALYFIWVDLNKPHRGTGVTFEEWLSCYARPRHYLIAAAKLKEKSNGR